MVIDPLAGSVSSSEAAPGLKTFRFASCGMNLSIGSSNPNRPSSNSNSAAQEVINFVLEKTRKIWSCRNGICASLSAHPTQLTSTRSRPTSTADETPESRLPST